ncbi:MAG: hypothetical protein LRY67_07225 [Gammaproteobacteria bacterium]|nr:hypothetical protein [Gammaproteobacteria bacterium]
MFIKFKKMLTKILNHPAYKVHSIDQDENDNYIVKIQIIRKSLCFDTTPEKILSSDRITNKFSPTDIRTLTYLGYLDINSPKYKIMAQKLAENDQLVLLLREKKKNKLETKLPSEISINKENIKNFDSNDAHLIGYAQAMEDLAKEKKLKLSAKNKLDY